MGAIRWLGWCFSLLLGSHVAANETPFTGLKGQPGLRSASANVLDSDGNLIYGKDVDTIRPIASITKLMTAMIVLDADLQLEEKITITRDDRDRIKQTRSRLTYGAKLTRKELLLLALMSSENRAAKALGRAFPGGTKQFVAAMNTKRGALRGCFCALVGCFPRLRIIWRSTFRFLPVASRPAVVSVPQRARLLGEGLSATPSMR